MEEQNASALSEDSGQTVISTHADLRDEYYHRLVEDFLGNQSGEKLHIDKTACKNRLLVQVGLLKEDNRLAWVNVTKWLQKILPTYKSSDFRTLIERSMATAMSLSEDARHKFLESNVNFEFVGPICDILGIGRSDLLQMSDLSERAKCMDVSNGLVLELSSFVKREKIDPIVLVSWLRNFNRNFCSDGKIHKAYKVLQRKLHKLRLDYRVYQKHRHRKNAVLDIFLQTEFDLGTNKLRYNAAKPSNTSQDKREHRKSKEGINGHDGLDNGALTSNPRQSEDISNQADESNMGMSMELPEKSDTKENTTKYLSLGVFQPSHTANVTTVKEEGHSSNSQRPQIIREVVKGTMVSPSALKTEVLTLLDLAILFLEKLSHVYGSESHEAERVSKDLLQKHFLLTLAGNPVMRCFNDSINKFQTKLCSVTPLMHFLDCNARFLLNVSVAIEQHIIAFEKEIISATGERLGRDKSPKFANFVNFSESTATRYIRMVCDVLSPPAESKYSCRRQWVHFCQARNKTSRLAVSRSNRFINYYECAASAIHHHGDIVAFFSDLEPHLGDGPNVVLESVKDDLSDQFIQALVCVLAVVYCKILGPYWQLLKSGEEYVSFRRYVQRLHQKLIQWGGDTALLLLPESSGSNVFHQVPLQEKNFEGVFLYCGPSPEKHSCTLIATCLGKIVKTVVGIMEADLKDFLPDGIYSKDPALEQCLELRNFKMSHLMCEYPYGHGHLFVRKKPASIAVSLEDHSQSQEAVEQRSAAAAVTRSEEMCVNQQDVEHILINMGGTNGPKQEMVQCDIVF